MDAMLKRFLPVRTCRPETDPIVDTTDEDLTAPTLSDIDLTPTPNDDQKMISDDWPEQVYWIVETASRFLSPLKNVQLLFGVLEEDETGETKMIKKKFPASVYCNITACPILWPGEKATRAILILHAQIIAIEVKKRMDHSPCAGCRNIFAFRNELIEFICNVLDFQKNSIINISEVIDELKEASVAYYHLIGLLLSEHFVTRDEETWLFEYLNSGSRDSCVQELKKSTRKRFLRRMEELKECWFFSRGSVEDLWFLKTWQPKFSGCKCAEEDL